MQAGWSGWRRVSGLICDRRFVTAMMHGLGTVPTLSPTELEIAELKMLRFSVGVTRMDRITKEKNGGTAKVERFGGEVRVSSVSLDRSGYVGH